LSKNQQMTIRTLTIYLFLTFSFAQIGLSQIDSIKVQEIVRTNIEYKSFTTIDNKLFAINDSGQVIIWDLTRLDTVHFAYNNKFRYTAISKDRENQVFIGTDKGEIYKLNPNDLSFSLFHKLKYRIHSICFNSDNKIFVIVPYAVYDPITKKYWTKFENHAGGLVHRKKIMRLFWKRTDKFFSMPQFTYLDNNDRWWMCSSYGEFGGEAQIFDTKNSTIYNNKFEGISTGLFFPKSVFNDNDGNIYITSGLEHFTSSGEIYKISSNRIVTKIFDSRDYRDTIKQGIFVGPGAYNKKDNSIYFASTKGFYKASLPINGKLQNLQLIFNPSLSWGREPLAIGIGMAIKRIEFTTDNKLLFLTSNDGFGIYDGHKLIFLK
jgi:hypothetical protein